MKKLLLKLQGLINPPTFSAHVPDRIKSTVMGFITDISAWEFGMFKSHKISLGWHDSLIPYEGEPLDVIMQRWCTQNVIAYESFGFPLKHDPQTEKIIGVSHQSKSLCLVRTIYTYMIPNHKMKEHYSYETCYEYSLILMDGTWKIDSLWIFPENENKYRYF